MLKKFDNLRVRAVDDELLVYNLDNNSLYVLNETSSAIWNLCEGDFSIESIVEAILAKYDEKRENLYGYVKATIEQFKALGILREYES